LGVLTGLPYRDKKVVVIFCVFNAPLHGAYGEELGIIQESLGKKLGLYPRSISIFWYARQKCTEQFD
jgi:hypothetical protein